MRRGLRRRGGVRGLGLAGSRWSVGGDLRGVGGGRAGAHRRGMILDPASDLEDGGVLNGACGVSVGESGMPTGREAEIEFEVAGVRL